MTNTTTDMQQLDRIELDAFLKKNPMFDLLTFNLFSQESVADLKWGRDQQEALLPQLKALQRLVRLMSGHIEVKTALETAEKLYNHGLHSALQIAAMQKQEFVAEFASYFPAGLVQNQTEHALLVYEKALARKTKSVMTYSAISQHTAAHYQASRFDNLSGATAANFNGLPSYQELFGGLDFCTCPHCRSILSPAAYFVDLMRLQSKFIDPKTLAFPLKDKTGGRRRDLWHLVLSCSNTNTLVPTIQIVNEVLYANSGKGIPDKGTSQDQVYKSFDNEVYPFNLPFNLPLEKIRQDLCLEKSTLNKVWEALTPSYQLPEVQSAMDMEALGVSPAQWNLYSTPKPNKDDVNYAYGLPDDNKPKTALSSVDIFLQQTGLTHELLYELLYEDINDKGINSDDESTRQSVKESMAAEQVNFFINVGSDKPVELKDGIEELANLNNTNLDHIHRFVRLSQVVGWSFTDLDWALHTSGQLTEGEITVLDNSILPYLGWIKGIQNQQSTLTVSQICSYIGQMKDRKTKNDGPSFFDTIYNAAYVPNPPVWQNESGIYDLTWDVPELSKGPSGTALDQQIQSALTAALKLTQNELLLIANFVLVAERNGNERTLSLSLCNLTVFYRFSQLPVLTGLSLKECLVALNLPGGPSGTIFDNKQSGKVISWLIAYARWVQSTAVSTYQVQYFLTGQSEDATISNRILGEDAALNFQRNFGKTMAANLITKTLFGDALGEVLNEPEYSLDAAAEVYAGLTKDGKYIDPQGNVVAIPTEADMRTIVVDIFPPNADKINPNVVGLSDAIIVILDQYLHDQEPLLEGAFIEVSQNDFVADMVAADLLLNNIWNELQKNEILNIESADTTPQLVLKPSLPIQVQDAVESALFPKIFEEQLAKIANLVCSTLNQYYELQQNALNQSLEGLLNIAPQLCSVIEVWEALSVGDLEVNQARIYLPDGGNNHHATIPLIQAILNAEAPGTKKWKDFIKRIQLLQTYTVLTKVLSISIAEARSIIRDPEFYDVNYEKGSSKNTAFQFSLENIQTLDFFKTFIHTEKDTQNRFLDYLNYVGLHKDKITDAARLLSQITGWNQGELVFLMTNLWPAPSEGVPVWGTVAGVEMLSHWFLISKEANLDTNSLWQVYQLALLKTSTSEEVAVFYDDCSVIATEVWSGLVADERKVDTLRNLNATMQTIIRDATVGYVMNYLRTRDKPVPLTNSRDLYNYLLIDVEVGAAVETSYIKSAISSVQLFIQRCRNNLEPGVKVEEVDIAVHIDDELNEWWDWMSQYRVWEANRKVFLYPENYIQPELRPHKTPIFAKLESELKQGDLRNPATVETAFQNYLDDFAAVANLKIVSSAGYDVVDKREKVICLIGRTAHVPFHHYHRTVRLVRDQDSKNPRYIPLQWNPWQKVDMNINAIGPINPVFAFGKWFLFWIEQQQCGEEEIKDSNDKVIAKIKRYQATCYCTYLNFNQEWVAPRVIGDPVAMRSGIEEMDDDDIPYWNQVYPVYFNTIGTIIAPYGQNEEDAPQKPDYSMHLFTYNEGKLKEGAVDLIRYADTNPFLTNGAGFDNYADPEFDYSYWNSFGVSIDQASYGLVQNDMSFSTWLSIKAYPTGSENETVAHFYDDDDKLLLGLDIANPTGLDITINGSTPITIPMMLNKDEWHHLTVATSPGSTKERMSSTSHTDFSNLFNYQGNVYMLRITDAKLKLNQIDPANPSGENSATLTEQVLTDGKACLFEFKDDLYVSWMNVDNSVLFAKVKLDESRFKYSKIENKQTLQNITTDSIPGYAELDRKLHLTWKNTGSSNKLTVGIVDISSGSVSESRALKNDHVTIQCMQSPAMLTYQDCLILSWNEKNEKTDGRRTVYEYPICVSVYYPASSSDIKPCLLCPSGQIKSKYWTLVTPNLSYGIDDEVFITWQGMIEPSSLTKNRAKPDIASFMVDKNDKGLWTINTDQTDATEFDHLWAGMYTPGLAILNDQILMTTRQIGHSWITFSVLPQLFLSLDGNSYYRLCSNNLTREAAIKELYLGNNKGDAKKLDGVMQEVLVYNRMLSSDEIALLYQNSVNLITQDYEAIGNAVGVAYFDEDVTQVPVLSQPACVCIEHSDISLLGNYYPQSSADLLDCYRLNTMAFNRLSQTLYMQGIATMLDVPTQETPEVPFEVLLPKANFIPEQTWPSNTIDFNAGAMSEYYWEVFFFAPFLIAYSLEKDQRFERATTWYQYIFNPTINQENADLEKKDPDKNDKYWRFLGLRSYNNPILNDELSLTWAEETEKDLSNTAQLYAYHYDPFDPQAIARLRPIAYQKTMVMHYIKNTLNWADNLFRRYTVESIVEANMLYVTAYDLLGQQPVNLGPCPLPEAEDLKELVKDTGDSLDDMPEFLIQLENQPAPAASITTRDTPNNYISSLYFGLPENSKFIEYWDLVESRLYNIRHGLNIDGVKQLLPLFEPAINPAQLIQQMTSGQSVSATLASMQVSIPYYRFEVMVQKAKMLVQTVSQFGQSLLATLEKKNAESLSLLQSRHQQNILALTTGTRQAQLEAAEQSVQGLQYSLQNAQDRHKHYKKLLTVGWSAGEEAQVALEASAIPLMTVAQPIKITSVAGYISPKIFGLSNGGMDFGSAVSQAAHVLEGTASTLNMAAGLAGTISGYQRREEDWTLQKQLAQDDIDQINSQILSAQYQVQSAQEEVAILQKSIDQEQEVAQFLKNKFTSEQLYQWMSGQLSSLYFQAYQLAYHLALQAERSWQFEQGKKEQFIQPNYWNSLYEGLVSGEALQFDIERMEAAYMQQNDRRLEIQKTISLSTIDNDAFEQLKDNGECIFDLTEIDFDYDYPGHYCRQIKSITLTIPALLGPYQNIHATLTQTSNKTLLTPDETALRYLLEGGDQPGENTLRVDAKANQQVALSQGVNDSGLFELNFNDERYLPFEGTGAVSSWKLDMPTDSNPIDLEQLSDVIIRVNYTAVSGGLVFQSKVKEIVDEIRAIAKELESITPKKVTQSYADNTLTAKWEILDNKAHMYQVKVVHLMKKSEEVGSKKVSDKECLFSNDEDLSSSNAGSHLITAVRTLIGEKEHTPYIYAESSNYRFGQAIIEDFSNDNTQLTFFWKLPESLPGSSHPEATGYDYLILPDGELTHVDGPSGETSINISMLDVGTYQLQIRATGGTNDIPGNLSDQQTFEVSGHTHTPENVLEEALQKEEYAKPKNVIQSYAFNQLTTSWEGPENKSYHVKVVNQRKKSEEFHSATSDTTESSISIADLSQSKNGVHLISAVRTIVDGVPSTPYIEAETSNYRLGQAVIIALAYDNDTITGIWMPPMPLDPQIQKENATGYDYQILDTSGKIVDRGSKQDLKNLSIQTHELNPGTYRLQILATGEEGVIPGEWSKSQSFATRLEGNISTYEELQDMKPNENYVLAADIDCKGKGFVPIGNNSQAFSGTFNGNGYTIKNLTIDTSTEDNIGLFGYTSGAHIANVVLLDVNITGASNVGGLVGYSANGTTIKNSIITGVVTGSSTNVGVLVGHSYMKSGQTTIENCYATGSVNGGSYVGGLVGQNSGSCSILNSCATVIVTGSGGYAGGLVGNNTTGGISESYATGIVTGTGTYVGGLVGCNSAGGITYSYATGNVEVTGSESFSNVGGLVGYSATGGITYSCATGDVKVSGSGSSTNVGGLVGHFYIKSGQTTIENCYATGSVNGGSYVGGLVGQNSGSCSIINSCAIGIVTGSGGRVGGLVGNNTTGGISESYATGIVTGSGTYVGGLVGCNSAGGITFSYATGIVTAFGSCSNVGGLVGYSATGGITDSYATGQVEVTGSGSESSTNVGGLVGHFYIKSGQTKIENCSAIGNVNGGSYVGGLVGQNSGSCSILNSYATGIVTGPGGRVGGLVGNNTTGGISESYATGRVTGSSTYVGGLMGCNSAGGITDSYATGNVEVTESGSEPCSNVGGLVGYSATGGITDSYATGDVKVTGSGSSTNVGGLVGHFYIKSGQTTIENSSATGSVSGGSYVGGLVGQNSGSCSIINSCAIGVVTGSGGRVGGLVGNNTTGGISESYATGCVTGSGTYVGGLVGCNSAGGITYSYATGIVTAFGSCSNVGGLMGYSATGGITDSYATGQVEVTGSGSESSTNVGGLVGHFYIKSGQTKIENCSAIGSVNGGSYVGGLVGQNSGSCSILNSCATGIVTGSGGRVGGLVGNNTTGGITDSYATGCVTGSGTYVGGLMGCNSAGGITDSYATGNVEVTESGSEPCSNVGGLVGYSATGGITDSYATGNVEVTGSVSSTNVGGLVGHFYIKSGQAKIENCSAIGSVNGGSYIGGLVGQNSGSCSIINSCAIGIVTGSGGRVGGLVGNNTTGGISESYATGSVTGSGTYVGGLVGCNSAGGITYSYATGIVTAFGSCSNVGGLVGYSATGGITYSYATGNVQVTGSGSESSTNVGGLVGHFYIKSGQTTIENCYATGSVNGGNYVGGLLGQNSGSCSIKYCYAVGSVTGSGNLIGGLVGNTLASVIDSYYDMNTTGQDDTDKGTGETDEAMKTRSTFVNWDFGPDGVWSIVEKIDYPRLQGMPDELGHLALERLAGYNEKGRQEEKDLAKKKS